MSEKVNLFIVGTVKAGTTWLYDVLGTSCCVFAPNLKEPHFFTESRRSRKFMKSIETIDEYHKRIEHGKAKYLIDGSATYVSDLSIPQKIHDYNKDAKIIMMLRHPVRRAFSQYVMDIREGNDLPEFSQALKEDVNNLGEGRMYVGLGKYFEIVKAYVDTFGAENVLIIPYIDLLRNKVEILEDVSSMLNIPNDFSLIEINSKKNVAAVPRNKVTKLVLKSDWLRYVLAKVVGAKVRQWVKNRLLTKSSNIILSDEECHALYIKYFKDDSEKLFDLLNRKMWNESRDI
ncbi:MAG: hypothetical protein ACI936_002321 [Paraglaciecola sp.]|jgi:hypothetical protein